MELLLEKVYNPCILVTMKRYCGLVYTSPNQKIPSFESKGLETVIFYFYFMFTIREDEK
jgi:DNA polymerase zeta